MKSRFAKGFSLTEVAIAIFIMVMGVVWVYSSINDMIRVSNNAVSRLEAGFLATEGMEFIKNKRDENYVFYLNNQSTGACGSDFKTNFYTPCNWMFGIRQVESAAFNIDLLSAPAQSPFIPENMSAYPNCQGIASRLAAGGEAIKECLGDIYKGNSYKYLVRSKDDALKGIFLLDNEMGNSEKTHYKRLVIVSPATAFPGDLSQFPAKYSASAAMCGGNNTVVDADKINENSDDKVRVDSIVFWMSGGGIEYIHLSTYLFDYHQYY